MRSRTSAAVASPLASATAEKRSQKASAVGYSPCTQRSRAISALP